MNIYIIESFLFSICGIGWISIEENIINANNLDQIFFYSFFIYSILCIFVLLSIEDELLLKIICNSMFHVCLAIFFVYLHVIQVCILQNTVLCDNKSCLGLWTGTYIQQFAVIITAISFSLWFLQILVTSSQRYDTIVKNIDWIDLSLLLQSTLYFHVITKSPNTGNGLGYVFIFFWVVLWLWKLTQLLTNIWIPLPPLVNWIISCVLQCLWQISFYIYVCNISQLVLVYGNLFLLVTSICHWYQSFYTNVHNQGLGSSVGIYQKIVFRKNATSKTI